MVSSLKRFSDWELYETLDMIPTTFSCGVTIQLNFEREVDPDTETQ